MIRYSFILSIMFSFTFSTYGNGIIYGYDDVNNEIYAKIGGDIKKMKFETNYTNNPSYSFDFFSDVPAIVTDGRSLHDFTSYATLIYRNEKFYIDCFYYNIKSKQNGILAKEGKCGLNYPAPQNYAEYIEMEITSIETNMDSLDTSLVINGKMKYLPVIIRHDADGLFYKLYDTKQSFLNDNYAILHMKKNGDCDVYNDSPWVVGNNTTSSQFDIMTEKYKDGKIILTKASPKSSDINMCLLYPAISVKSEKSFFYDESFKMKKSYLIKGDKINLHSISSNGKWCRVDYINSKNKIINGNVPCVDLTI